MRPLHTRRRRLTLVLLLLTLSATAPEARGENGKLTVRVTDAGSDEVMPARLSLRAADGTFPGDRLGLSAKEWPGLEAHAVYIAGEQTLELPAGEVVITAARGPQYASDSVTVRVPPNGTATAGLKLRRLIDLRRLGWVGGDAHLHMIHGEMQRPTSYADVAATCRAAGLDWAGLNQEYGGAGELDLAGYHAACAKVSTDDFRLFLGGERPKSLLGHCALVGVPNPFVVPDDPPYHRSARAIHDQGGVSLYVHPTRYFPDRKYLGKWLDFPGNNLARELVFDAFLGPSFDALSVLSDEPADATAHALWFNLLNRGLSVPAAADSDACFDRPTFGYHAPGFWMTYVHTGPGGPTDPAAVAAGIRKGRTMATTGPLVLFDVDGQLSGATLVPDGKAKKVHIRALHAHHVWTLADQDPASGKPVGVGKVELIRSGKVVKTWEPAAPAATLEWTVTESEPCWYAVRVFGTDAKWQVAVASPVYFADREPSGSAAGPGGAETASKRPPLAVTARGRVYDFESGEERRGTVEVRRDGRVLKRFNADGQFKVRMPLDAELAVSAEGGRPVTKGLLLDYGPVHRFLWYLKSADLGRPETFDQLEALVREVDLEFPLGHRLSGCYVARDLTPAGLKLDSIEAVEGPPPPKAANGSTAVAAVLLDAERVAPGDTVHVAAVFRYEGDRPDAPDMRLVIEGRAYDPSRPTGFNPLKLFGGIEENWSKVAEIGHGYRVLSGTLTVPKWASAGAAGAVEINVRTRGEGGRDGGFVGLRLPLADRTARALAVCSGWPTMPLSWPDHSYGVGPFAVCGKIGREGQPKADYRTLRLNLKTDSGEVIDLLPARDGKGCPDADDAVFAGHFFDQVLNEESRLATPDPVRPQPKVRWREVPVVDATVDR